MTKLARAIGMKEYRLTIDEKNEEGDIIRRTQTVLAMNEADAWDQICNTVDAPADDAEMCMRRVSWHWSDARPVRRVE